ncbi:hypothetical protein [Streptomyces doebereineriae]|uniref:Uncharacterized protein n=1 Tax=Streptomyces doebereineriae TaxID=3075528 RepID=A0ABU2VKW5_9ACTN|nr:hypothetical protein [Streptomyces sp. DSM 41640]MDT0486246.1 hypothetical protein [Streptomyces sp. DSM 41640]
MFDPKVSRRQVLVLGGLTLGVGAVTVAGPGPAWADTAAAAGVELVPVGASPVAVLAGVGVQPAAFPRQLAVQVKHAGTDLPAGTQVAISYDPRLYSPLPAAVATVGDRRLRATSTVSTDPRTSVTACTVTLTEALPAGSDPVVVVGTAFPVLYPYDLVAGPAGATAAVHHKNVRPTDRSLQPGRPHAFGGVATPWGLEVSGVWNRCEWANGKRWYYYPARITLNSVGPGTAPVAASFSVALDPQVVSDVRIVSARLNNKVHDAGVRLLSDTRTASLFETRWATRVKLKSGDRLDLELAVRTRKPTGDLPTVKHPTVGLINMGDHITQRQTGRTSMSRSDSEWT